MKSLVGVRNFPGLGSVTLNSSVVLVEEGGALARATSIGPRATTGLEVSVDAAGWYSSLSITRRGSNNDRLSTPWREVISLTGVATSFSSGGLKRTGATMEIQVRGPAIAIAIAVPIAVTGTATSSAAPINGASIKAAAPAVDGRALSGAAGSSLPFVLGRSHL